MEMQPKFLSLWQKYFPGAELPLSFFYADTPSGAEEARSGAPRRCFIGDLVKVRRGQPLAFSAESIGCFGGRRYLGFSQEVMPNFEYFLSCGIPGQLEGERYKKSPELVIEAMKHMSTFEAPAKYIVFKRWDQLAPDDQPEAVIFFAPPDVLSGLFTLANFDEAEPAVHAPFAAGCGSIVQYPHLENAKDHPRAILGMFDVSARPFVEENILSFSVPIRKFESMLENMEESFLITESWAKVRKRFERRG